MSENDHSKKKIDYKAKPLIGFGMLLGSANLIWILTSEYQITILVSEAVLAIALLGYGIRRAGLNQRKSDEATALSEQKYLKSLEDNTHAASFFNRE
ncbi:MAG: hypothetical protein AAB705_01425 [Patescibacteria group bacterium]